MNKKVVWLPYDMDTAIGINNDGQLVFDYRLEDIDYQTGGQPIFNGQESVIWKNVRAAFADELKTMYQNLRSSGALSYEKVEQMFEEHQAKWSEAIFNEDAYFKYIEPFVKNNQNYLYMLQGSKAEQRKWWLYNRFRYIDSKYIAGDARNDSIFLRPYAVDDITVIPYADIYATVAWDATITQERTTRGSSVTLHCPYSSMNGNIVNIYSSSQLASVGDLSGLKVGQINIASATRLQELKIGDSDSEYDNANLYDLTFGNNVLLKKVDVRNCSGFGDTSIQGHTQTTVDLSGCSIIEEVYFSGTKIQGITLPNGGVLKKLHLPATMTNLTILNQKNITELIIPSYANITTLRLENVSTAVDEKAILRGLTVNETQIPRVRLIGIHWECTDAAEIDGLLGLLDTMRGLDESGGNVEQAQVSGTIHTTALTGAQIAEFEARYPYITYEADYVESTLTLKTYDGSETVATITCYNGTPQSAIPTPPARANSSDGHYSYTAVGWNLSQDAEENDPTATQNVTADRTVYAAYSKTVRTYTITWKNGSTTLRTDSNVAWGTKPVWGQAMPTNSDSQTATGWDYDLNTGITGDTTISAVYKPMYTISFVRATADGGGTLQTVRVEEGNTPAYTGATPTTTQGDATDYPFEEWTPTIVAATADATYTAKFGSPVEVAEITDSWDTIIANIDNGTYKTAYKIGNYKPLDLGTTYGTVNMQIVAMDADELASGGTAPLTFLAMELLLQTSKMNSTKINTDGYIATNVMKPLLDNTIYPLLPSNIKERVQRVNKTYYDKTTDSTLTGVEKLWIPSAREVTGQSTKTESGRTWYYEDSGVEYTTVFKDNASRIKTLNGSSDKWWLRTAESRANTTFILVSPFGATINRTATETFGVCIGFCLGLESSTIEDDWSTILANENPSATYSIGDTKSITINNEQHLMQIVGFDLDDKTSGGKAKISWLMRDLLNTKRAMNSTDSNANGWIATELRTWLRNTVLPTIDTTIRSHIVDVDKTYYDYSEQTTQKASDNIWLPSARELFGGTSYESSGCDYTALFTDSASKIKKISYSAESYWTRSSYKNNATNFQRISDRGGQGSWKASVAHGICIGFCTD